MTERFRDRADAGRRLAAALASLAGEDLVVLGLPRGGVPVAYEVATALGKPLDVAVVRKLGLPYQRELGMGAVGEGGVRVVNHEVLAAAGVGEAELAAVAREEQGEVARRAARFRGGRPRIPLQGRTVVVVDDGIATGATARAACQVARAQGAARVVVAVPVAPGRSVAALSDVADAVVCLERPASFLAVGQLYRDFSQTTDDEVVALLHRAAALAPRPPASPPAGTAAPGGTDPPPDRLGGIDGEVAVDVGGVPLAGHLSVPATPRGVVVFVHGSGSSRHSPRNRFVAGALQAEGLGTLLVDLLTTGEETDRSRVFDIELLTDRLVAMTGWLQARPGAAGVPIGYFGASTGAAAALSAASRPGSGVAAVVSRGGRPDLAGARLVEVRAPTLLIVGGRDDVVLELNRRAQAQLRCPSQLTVVPGATHLFEEPGALPQVARLAGGWFLHHLAAAPA